MNDLSFKGHDMKINLPEDGHRQFNLSALLKYLVDSKRYFIVVGQQHEKLEKHTKDLSLDYWIRKNIAVNKDTAQATDNVVEQICATGLFTVTKNACPNTGVSSKAIELI